MITVTSDPPGIDTRVAPLLTVENARISFDGVDAVRDVSLTVDTAEVVALLGPSGCGKSTLLRGIAGLEPLTAGRVLLNGSDLAGVPVFRRSFSLMFQDGALFAHRSVAANIGYGLQIAGADRALIRRRVRELLHLVGLEGFGERSVATLSGGQAQRVALARALAPNPRLLLLDEPLAALDAALREQLLVDLRRILAETATPTVFVTHDQDEAFAIADRVALMHDGRIRQQGTPRDVWRHPVDAWSARFVGYTTILDHAGSAVLRPLLPVGLGAAATGPLAVRPSAFWLDPEGAFTGRLLSAVPGPDRSLLILDVDGIGPVHALGADVPGSSDDRALDQYGVAPRLGASVRVRFNAAGAAALPIGTEHDEFE